jgi:hypothetical protein
MPHAATIRDESDTRPPDLLDPQDIDSFRNDPRLPELAALSLKQRQYVWKHCAKPLLSRRRIILAGFANLSILFLIVSGMRLFIDIGNDLTALIIGTGLALHNQCWIACCRRRIRTFIAENGPALQAAEKEPWLRMPPKLPGPN